MSKDEEKEESSFSFQDRRSSRLSEEDNQQQEQQIKKEQEKEAQKHADQEDSHAHDPQGQMEINFSTFVLSLTSSAFYYLGDIPDPMTGQTQENLPAVQQTIDILTMLKAKTQNNLDHEEQKLLEQLIYELQMKYIAKQKKGQAPSP
ncbi:DUF1844 domain-containing protein [Nitrospina sp. 32_T5]|uniref:DUF1844 domain-containing protein n=1 Tax=unclassified Nitrospina TaxID=2638683 RepID=UPI003F987B78